MATFLLAQPTSDNTGGGALLSLWFLLGLFIIVAAILWAIYTRPHGRVPPRTAAPAQAQAHGATRTADLNDATGASGSASGSSAGDPATGQPSTPPQPGTDDIGRPE